MKCPYCDHEAEVISVEHGYYVACNASCGVNGPMLPSHEEAVDGWNRLSGCLDNEAMESLSRIPRFYIPKRVQEFFNAMIPDDAVSYMAVDGLVFCNHCSFVHYNEDCHHENSHEQLYVETVPFGCHPDRFTAWEDTYYIDTDNERLISEDPWFDCSDKHEIERYRQVFIKTDDKDRTS